MRTSLLKYIGAKMDHQTKVFRTALSFYFLYSTYSKHTKSIKKDSLLQAA